MAHFARISDGVVVEVLVVDNAILLDEEEVEQEALGVAWLQGLFGGEWVQTSYNGSMRRKYAGIGDLWDENLQMFFAADEQHNLEHAGVKWLALW